MRRGCIQGIAVFLAVTGSAVADTEVFVRNNTPHFFTIRHSIRQPGTDPLPIGSYYWNTHQIQPMVRTKLLQFTRAAGVKNGEEYELHSELRLGDESIDLRQKMRGTPFHSKLWYSATNDPWFEGRDWHVTQWNTKRGLIEVAYRAYYTGGDDDIQYVLNPIHAGNPTQDTLNVLAYNIYMRPTSLKKNGQAIRAELLPERLRDYDVIAFSEAFDDGVREDLLDRVKPDYRFHTRILGSDEGTEQDGGVIIASKWPILEEDQVEFEHQNLRDFGGAKMCHGDEPAEWARGLADCLAEKGVLYARIGKEERTFHIFGTHLQAGDGGVEAAVRTRQLLVIKAFIDSKKIPADETVIVAGDLNIEKDSPEYFSMLKILNARHPPTTGHPYTVDPAVNRLTGSSGPRFIDYVLLSNAHLQPASASVETRLLYSRIGWKEYPHESEYWDLSDHFPVYGRLQYGRPAFQLSPAAVDFGRVERNTFGTRLPGVTVSSVGSGPVTVQSVRLEGPQANFFSITPRPPSALPVTLPPGSTFPISVGFRSGLAGAHQARVAVTGLDISGTPVTSHAVLLANVVEPDIAVVPSALNFGLVRLGQQVARNVLVTNNGSSSLRFRVNPPTQVVFQWAGDAANAWHTVPSGGSEVIAVRYKPVTAGAHTAQIAIASDDGTVSVPLVGEGVR